MPKLILVPLGLLAALLAAPGASAVDPSPEALTSDAAEPELVPRYLLMDANGRAVTNEDFRGVFQLITFGYTACPDVCPTTLVDMSVVLKELGDQAERLQPLFVTVDPERDDAERLRTYTAHFHPRILGLTGSPALVQRAADNFKVRVERVRDSDAPSDRYLVDHTVGMFLLGPDGQFLRKFAYAQRGREIAEQIRELLADGS